GSSVAIAGDTAAQASLRLDAPGVYSVLLTATDAQGLPSFVPSRLDLRAAPAERLVVQLVWDEVPPDLDLHFLEQGAALDSGGDSARHAAAGRGVERGHRRVAERTGGDAVRMLAVLLAAIACGHGKPAAPPPECTQREDCLGGLAGGMLCVDQHCVGCTRSRD